MRKTATDNFFPLYKGEWKGVWVLLLLFIFLLPFGAFAYSDTTTHPALTDEIVDLFNLYYPAIALTDEEKELVKEGSVLEDADLRFMHHFYDPVYNRGLWGNSSSKIWAEATPEQALLDPGYRQGSALAAVSTGYFDSRADYSWERAIYDYVWRDQKRGLLALGSVLHLIEDASVPDHTRNDPHPPILDWGSPYEAWTKKFTPESWDGLSSAIYRGTYELPVELPLLKDYFNSLAGYSNNNFFSADSIFDEEYLLPQVAFFVEKILSNGNFYKFGIGKIFGNEFYLVRVPFENNWAKLIEENDESPVLSDKDDLILTDYWTHLSKQAVLHGAGVVRLFFEAAEKERESRVLLAKNKSTLDKFYSAVAGYFGAEDDEPEPLVDEITEGAFEPVLANEEPSSSTLGVDDTETPSVFPLGSDVIPDEIDNFESAGNTKNEPSSEAEETNETGEGEVLGESFEPARPAPAPLPQILPSPGFGGGSPIPVEEEAEISSSSKLGFDEEKPSFFPEEISEADTEPPDVSLEIAECLPVDAGGDSLSADGCLLATTTLNLSWSSAADDLERFELGCLVSPSSPISPPLEGGAGGGKSLCADFNADFASTTATSTQFVAADFGKYEFFAKAIDGAGNESEEAVQAVEIVVMPVVINEVAWAGTLSGSVDEWIELYNNTSYAIDLSGWVLAAEDGSPYLGLSKSIEPRGYFLIERTDDETVSDVRADLTLPFSGEGDSFGLSNSGEVLILSRGPTKLGLTSTTIDRTVLCGNRWCGGAASGNYPSMERIEPDLLGSDLVNWGSANDRAVSNGLDKDGRLLTATPKKRNSLNYLIAPATELREDLTLYYSRSPYIVPRGMIFNIREGAVLKIEPGVAVKIGGESEMRFEGVLDARGTEERPIVFTSIYDDDYAGDTNGDATSTMPGPGAWKNILFFNSDISSVLEHVIFKYGGRWFNNMQSHHRTMVALDGAKADIKHSEFSDSRSMGLTVISSDALIEDSYFSVGSSTPENIGMLVGGGEPKILNNKFNGNRVGLNAQSTPALIEGNKFYGNADYAFETSGFLGILKNNEGAGNGVDGISISGDLARRNFSGTTTLYANKLPFVIRRRQTANVPAGSAVEIEKSVKILGDSQARLEVSGSLYLKGESPEDILFSSLSDAGPGDWGGINVLAGGKVFGGGFTLRHAGRYGARCNDCAGFELHGGEAELARGIIENNFQAGMRLEDRSTTTLSNFVFRDHTEGMGGVPLGALVILNSAAYLNDIVFSGNTLAVFAAGINDIQASNLSFSENTSTTTPADLF